MCIYTPVYLIDKWRLVAIYSYRKISLALDLSVIPTLFLSFPLQAHRQTHADLLIWLCTVLKCYRTANLSMLNFDTLSRATLHWLFFSLFALFRFAMPYQVMPRVFACFACVIAYYCWLPSLSAIFYRTYFVIYEIWECCRHHHCTVAAWRTRGRVSAIESK